MMVSSAQQYHLKKDDANLSEALAEAYELARKMQTDLSTILMQPSRRRHSGIGFGCAGEDLLELGATLEPSYPRAAWWRL